MDDVLTRMYEWRHTFDCRFVIEGRCTCGLDEARARLISGEADSEGPLDVVVLARALGKVVPAVTFQAPAIAAEYARLSKGAAEQEEGNG